MITYNFFKSLWKNIKYTKILNKVYKDEHILENLSKMFNVEFKKDWIGRVYAVLNPHLMNGEFDVNKQIYEYNESGLDDSTFVEKWVMTNLNLAQQFIQAKNLFDLLVYKITKLDNFDNYLLVIQPVTLEDCKYRTKRFGWLCLILLILAGIFGIYLNFN